MGLTVLIADDETMPRTVLRDHLPWEELGVTRIVEASDGDETVEQARACRPDILISDVKMPRKTGLEAAEAIRAFCPGCQVVFLSGYSDKEYLKGAIRLKAVSYVEKPIDPEELTQVLREIVEERRRLERFTPQALLAGSPEGGGGSDRPPEDSKRLTELGSLIRHREKEKTEAALSRLYRDLVRRPKLDQEYLRHIYCQIVFLFLNAAETRNVTAVTRQADFLLYSAVKQETPEQLWGVLLQTARDYFSTAEPKETDIASRVEQILVRRHTDCTLAVQDVASELGYTNAYLCAAYKKSCGKTVNQRLTELRLGRAKKLLSQSEQKLYEVARSVGYSDGKYFAKLFTRETGLTPKEYREKHREI
ncbi:MAG: response regulator [Oscillospiraceae bacterium]|nr:response regulator [Oscillospiraceae bacterium]